MNDFLSGGVMMAALAVALFFARSWRRTGDRFFLLFALAFALLSAERWGLLFVRSDHELRHSVYLLRLAAFSLILSAVIDKNRSSRT
jgi:Family of unknown function (DUF5985)